MFLVVVGLAIGLFAGRLRWWLGVVILLLAAVIVSGIATAIVIANPEDYPFHMSVKSFGMTVLGQLKLLAPAYAVGWGIQWFVGQRRTRQAAELAAGRRPQPMSVWKYIWLRSLLFAAAATLLLWLRIYLEGSSNSTSAMETARRTSIAFLGFYAMFVAFAAFAWRRATPVREGTVNVADESPSR